MSEIPENPSHPSTDAAPNACFEIPFDRKTRSATRGHIHGALVIFASMGIEAPETHWRLLDCALDQMGRFGSIHWKLSQSEGEWEIEITRGIFTYSGKSSFHNH